MKRFLGSLVALAASLAWQPAASAVLISIEPSAQVVALGSPFSVDVRVSGLGDGAAPSLGAYDLDVAFNDALVSFSSAAFGTGLDVLGLGSIQLVTPGSGTVNLFELSLDTQADLEALQAGDFTLATLTFDAIAEGITPFSVTINSLADAAGDPLDADTRGGEATVRSDGGLPSDPVIPEPSSWALLLLGGGLLPGFRRRVALPAA